MRTIGWFLLAFMVLGDVVHYTAPSKETVREELTTRGYTVVEFLESTLDITRSEALGCEELHFGVHRVLVKDRDGNMTTVVFCPGFISTESRIITQP